MARKFSLNKTELTRLRREEKMYKQFLPVLQLKQEQLQIEQLKLKRELQGREQKFLAAKQQVAKASPLFAEKLPTDALGLARVKHLELGEKSVAGVKVPTLLSVSFEEREYSRFGTPPWVSIVLPPLRELVRQHTELSIFKRQYELVSRELRKATQKVNLFEKVLIPETKEGIRRIKIALGDEQVAAVGRGKIAKSKQQKASAEVLGAISSSIADTNPVFNKILESCQRLFEGNLVGVTLGYPVIVKPSKQGSTVGLSLVEDPAALLLRRCPRLPPLGHHAPRQVLNGRSTKSTTAPCGATPTSTT